MASIQPKVKLLSQQSAEHGKSRGLATLVNEQLSPLKTAVPITEEQTPINLHRPENMQPQADGVGV